MKVDIVIVVTSTVIWRFAPAQGSDAGMELQSMSSHSYG